MKVVTTEDGVITSVENCTGCQDYLVILCITTCSMILEGWIFCSSTKVRMT